VSKLIFRAMSLLAVCCFVLLVLLPVGTMAADTDKKSVAELYVTSWWPYCTQAKSFLASQGVEVNVYDIEKDAAAAKRKKELDSGRGVPFAVINGVKISGWSQRAYEDALEKWKKAGFKYLRPAFIISRVGWSRQSEGRLLGKLPRIFPATRKTFQGTQTKTLNFEASPQFTNSIKAGIGAGNSCNEAL
jgi:glutaredoxin